MSLWMLLMLMGLMKLVIAILMVWIPLRSDSSMKALPDTSSRDGDVEGGGDGGSKTLPQHPRSPHPRRPAPKGPRRGPHASPPPPPPRRIRHTPERVLARD